jgi:hypothetical protein
VSSYHTYSIAHAVSDHVALDMASFRQAERDVVRYCGMAFDGDTAEEIYGNALEHSGISRRETAGLNVSSLKALLRHRPTPGSAAWRNAPSMAFDTTPGEKSVLDDILADTSAR